MKLPIQVTIDADLIGGFIAGLIVASLGWLTLIGLFFKWLFHK